MRAAASPPPTDPPAPVPARGVLECPACGQRHEPVPLRPLERARCVRCGTTLAQGGLFRRDATLGFALTGLILGLGAVTLPFIAAEKFGNARTTTLFAGVGQTWVMPMYFIAFWVLLCGAVLPLLLLAGLVAERLAPPRRRETWWCRLAAGVIPAVDHWAIPEVQVLAILVAMIRLGSVINVHLLAGFYFYAGMAVAQLLAWRSHLYVDRPATGPAASAARSA